MKTSPFYTDGEILENTVRNHLALIAKDAPLSLPEKGEFFRKADRKRIRKGYRGFPPNIPAMKKLALRAIRVNRLIEEKRYKTIEVHPTSTQNAL